VFLFDLENLKNKEKELQSKTYGGNFWEDTDKAQRILQELKNIKNKIEEYEKLKKGLEDISVLLELYNEEEDESLIKEAEEFLKTSEKGIEDLKLSTFFNGEFDKNDAIMSIHPGAGGLEAQDWAEMLLRMYKRWAERKEFKVDILDILPDTEGGIKSVTLMVRGFNVYGYLKSEKGVHRLVRISPFDSSGRRHTSFASVDVFPDIDESISIDINPDDLKIDTYRSSGAGGQYVNTTDSAVRITHIPTGITVQCQNERSQHSNRLTAMKMLKAKLTQLAKEEQKEKIEDLQGKYTQIAWGSQIRSYIFHPYTLVKDHRTNAEVGDASRVMDGDLDFFMNEYLKMKVIK